jgi:UDP-N-acetylglucosamine:LPS N-acetylglucosamine transferase
LPYSVGNGEQARNIQGLLENGGAITISDTDFSRDYVASQLVPLLSSSKRMAEMAKAAKANGTADGAAKLLAMVKQDFIHRRITYYS